MNELNIHIHTHMDGVVVDEAQITSGSVTAERHRESKNGGKS